MIPGRGWVLGEDTILKSHSGVLHIFPSFAPNIRGGNGMEHSCVWVGANIFEKLANAESGCAKQRGGKCLLLPPGGVVSIWSGGLPRLQHKEAPGHLALPLKGAAAVVDDAAVLASVGPGVSPRVAWLPPPPPGALGPGHD